MKRLILALLIGAFLLQALPAAGQGNLWAHLDTSIMDANVGGVNCARERRVKDLDKLSRLGYLLDFHQLPFSYEEETHYGDYLYPSNGYWYSCLIINPGTDNEREIWAWRERGNPLLLVFLFYSMEANTNAQGHYGNHNYRWFAVDKGAWDYSVGWR